jgi:hypothetical protein
MLMLRHSQRGSLILLVMCLLAVLGIALASYLAVSNQAMKLSNRAYQTGVSEQLAEMGLEEALRAFNNNSFSTWSSNGTTYTWSTSGTTASCTITLPNTKYGTSGVTGTVSIRVDNYNADQLTSAWNSSANYRIGNLASYTDGNWYRCIADSLNKTPSATNSNSAYWLQEQGLFSTTPTTGPAFSPVNWMIGTSYVIGNMAIRNGSWYRCIASHTASSTNQPPSGANWTSYWVTTPYVSADADLRYTNNAFVRYYVTTYGNDAWYRWNGSSWDQVTNGTWTLTWHWTPSTAYNVGDIISYNNVWYRCKTAHTSGGSFTTTNWDTASTTATSTAAAWNWSSSTTYDLNDVVYYSSRWYRSTSTSNTNNTPSSSSAYWSVSPLLSISWDAFRQYNANDTVYYNGKWYLSRTSSNYGHTPPTAPTYIDSYWASTDYTTWQWNSSTSYSVGAYRSYGGVWYKCLSAGSNKSPNNSSYWTNSWSQGSGVTTGAPVIYSEGRATLPDGTATIKTQLRATIAPSPLFPNALAASSTLTINGGGTIDSYDSTVGTYASQTPGYSAVLAAAGTTSPAVTVTSTTVNGYVAAPSSSTSPYAPMWSYGGSAILRGTSSGTGIDVTRVSRSPAIPNFDCLPSGGLSAAFSAGTFYKGTQISAPSVADSTLNLGTPGAITPSIYYYDAGLRLQSGDSNYYKTVNINGPVILYTNGYLRAQTNGSIIVNDTGSAEIHVGTNLRAYSGCGGFINRTKDPKKLTLIGDGSTTTQSYLYPFTDPSGLDNSFYGTIYLPNTTATGGLTIYTGVVIYGALSAKNITFDQEATVHYDTSLRYATTPGVDQPWAIAEWRELTDSNDRAALP